MLFIGLSNTFLFAQSEDEFFHKAGFEYYKADYPKAHEIVVNGLEKYNSSEKLTKLKELICEQWPGCQGTPPPSQPCPDQDGDGICDEVDPCPDDETNSCGQIGCDSDRDNDGICDEDDACPDNAGIPHPVNNGCPKDSDGDGIWDMYDKCPDKRGQRNHSGCPDTDGDGVYDDVDRCDSDPGPSSNNGCPELEPTVRGCTDISAINYNPDATDNCCCKYQQKLKINLSHVQNTRKVTWHNDLRRASYLKLTLFKEINDEIVRERVVTGASSHTFRLPGSLANKKLRIELTVLYDENKYDISTSEVKVLRNQFFPCGDDE